MRRNIALLRAEQENASLAVENERTRFARDLHDILGHSLTVITVKAELAPAAARRRPRARPQRARRPRAPRRDALADVRRAVEGYRELTSPASWPGARVALAAAEIEARCPRPPTRCRPTCASSSPGPSARASPT